MAKSTLAWLPLAALILGCDASSEQTRRIELSDGWQQRPGDSGRTADGTFEWLSDPIDSPEWKPMTLPGYPRHSDKRAWMRIVLPKTGWRNPTLAIDPILTHYEAYLDGELIDEFGAINSDKETWRGLSWRLVSLPEDAGGKVLSLRFRSPFWKVGVQGRVYLGSRASHVTAIVRQDLGRAVSGLAAIVLGLIALIIAAVGRERRLTPYFGGFAIGSGIYAIYYTKLKELFWDSPLHWGDLVGIATPLSMICLLVLVERMFGAGRWKILRRLWRFHLVTGIAWALFVYTVGSRSPVEVQWITLALGMAVAFRLLIAIEAIALVAVVIGAARRGDTDARIFLVGLAPSALFTLREVGAAFGLVRFEWDSWTFIGVVTVVGSLVWILWRRYLERERQYAIEIERRSSEKAGMLRDLHDGIGGIATNISMLADVAARADSVERTERAIADISELSREGIAEIRSFVDSLDDSERTWKRLGIQLRHLGRQTLGPHDIDFKLDLDIEPSVAPPASALHINVTRIFREALTNVIKHARASRVTASLSVTASDARLSVVDDGSGEVVEGVGRGVANMKDRATALGGELRIVAAESPAGTQIELQIPLTSS